VELDRYPCEVRAGQYWRVDNLKSFDEFLEKKFPESRRKAYYLMAIHEQLPRQTYRDLREVGWTKATELAKVARAVAQSAGTAQGGVQTSGGTTSDRLGDGALGDALFQGLQGPIGGYRASD